MHNRKHSLRFSYVFLFLIFCLIIFAVRLVLVQVFRSSYLTRLAKKQHNYFIELEAKRGTIYDRNLRPVALNVAVYSLYAKPIMMGQKDKEKAIHALSTLLHRDPSYLRNRLSRKKYFMWLARKLPLELADKIKAMEINGLDFVIETKRYYPNQTLAAHLIGFAGIDNEGLDGLELYYNKYLKGKSGWSQILRDARQRALLIEQDFIPPRDGFNLVLTIDETIQYIAERALEKAFEEHNAKAASIIVLNPRTGEILALANRPTYNLEDFSATPPENRTNRAIQYTYEPGSVFKIVTAAAALEEAVAGEDDKFFCENGSYRIANHVLHDHHPHGTLTFKEIFEQSSNIGVAKIAQRLGAQRVYNYARRFRFGMKTQINCPGEVSGVLKSPASWSKTTIGAIPMGHEVTVTSLQLVCAIAAVANDGVYMRPFVVKYIKDNQDELIKEFKPTIMDQVITPETARRLKAILQGVVENGTGKRAKIEGIAAAGKTGTAQKVIDGVYSHGRFYASFFGFAPVEDPRVAVVVVFDEPHPSYFGGTVAAPVFQEVVQDTLKYLQVSGEEKLNTSQVIKREKQTMKRNDESSALAD